MTTPTYSDRLAMYPEVSQQSPCIKGTWVTAAHVTSQIVDGWTWSDILARHPEISEDDIRACLAWTIEQDNESIRDDVVMTRGHDRSDELRLEAELTRLRAVNAELVDEATDLLNALDSDPQLRYSFPGERNTLRAAVAKARKDGGTPRPEPTVEDRTRLLRTEGYED